jgi:serine phosphatase RsbU (regulator of sigma subunit)
VLRPLECSVRGFDLPLRVAGTREDREARSFRTPQRAEEPLEVELRWLVEDIYGPAVRDLPGLDVGRAYWGVKAAFPYGGDVVDVFRYGKGFTSIAVIDISGHGIRSAKHAGLTKHALRAYASQGYDALGAIRALNRLCIENCAFEGESEFFATAFFAIVDAEGGSMEYVSAGHEAACLVRGDGARFLDATGPILGLLDDDRAFRHETIALEQGDIIAAVTDGFTEARDEQLEFLGALPLASVIERHRDLTAEEQAEAVVRHAFTYAGPRLADDVAAVVVRVTEPASRRSA